MCRMLWSLPCCELNAELHLLEALLVRVGTFLTVCIVPEHFCTYYARENLPFLLLPCQESHSHVLGTSFGLFGSLKLSLEALLYFFMVFEKPLACACP